MSKGDFSSGVNVNIAPKTKKTRNPKNSCKSPQGRLFPENSKIIFQSGTLIGKKMNNIAIPNLCLRSISSRNVLPFSNSATCDAKLTHRIGQRLVLNRRVARSWCRGSTRGFQPLCPGSNPGERTKYLNIAVQTYGLHDSEGFIGRGHEGLVNDAGYGGRHCSRFLRHRG